MLKPYQPGELELAQVVASQSPDKLWALVTGASGGIGLELARLAAADGYNLVLVARGGDRLAEAAQGLRADYEVEVVELEQDLSLPGSAQEVFKRLGDRKIGLLINNAGFGGHGPFVEADTASVSGQIGVNVTALTELTRLVASGMVKRGSGFVLNIASIAAFAPGPFMAEYYATKAYVLSLSVALAEELRGTGVSVTALCPGPTQTGFVARAQLGGTPAFRGRLMSARTVAQIGYAGMRRGRAIVVPGWRARLQTWLTRLVPRTVLARVVRRVQE